MKTMDWPALITDSLVVIGPSIGYGFQYREIETKGSSEGFAPQVCIIVLISMIARIYFWLVLRFATPIFLQAVILVISQVLLLYQYQRFAKPKFPLWSSQNVFTKYMLSTAIFTIVTGLLTQTFHDNKFYVEILGSVAAIVEASLGIPQLYKNQVNRNTQGLSVIFILVWVVGDSFKTLYSVMVGAPIQLVLSAAFQLLVDILILFQIMIFGKGRTADVREKTI